MRASLGRHESVDLVDDDGTHCPQHLPPALTGQQQVEGFRGGHKDVGRRAQHALAFGGGSVTRAHGNTDVGSRSAALRLEHSFKQLARATKERVLAGQPTLAALRAALGRAPASEPPR